MSFAAETKEALCALFIKNECCELSLLWGLLRYGGDFSEEIAVYRRAIAAEKTKLRQSCEAEAAAMRQLAEMLK